MTTMSHVAHMVHMRHGLMFRARAGVPVWVLTVSQSVITTLLPTEHMAHCTLDLLGAAGSLD
mgnify:CR=1 FL=1|jgi:hypothetical protein